MHRRFPGAANIADTKSVSARAAGGLADNGDSAITRIRSGGGRLSVSSIASPTLGSVE